MSTKGRQERDSSANRAGRPAAGNQQETNEQPGRKYFLGIAIDEYMHWPKLRNARRDVRAVSRLLCDVYGFQEDDMTFLENEGATNENIINTLHKLVDNVGNTDSLIIYYAGHGHFEDRTKRGYWVPVNARNREIADYIQNSVIRDYLSDIPSLHTFLLSDACFSGSLFVRGYQRDGLLTAKELLQLQSRWALCSGRHNETVADGPPDGHSPFAESILDVLGKSDREYITLDFLLEQVREQTRANYSQLPDGGPLQFADHRRGQFVFMRQTARKPADEEAWERLQSMPEENIAQLTVKRTAASAFCDQFENSVHVPEVIRLGRQLHQKQRYLALTDDEFDLREFLHLYPESPYAGAVRERLAVIKSKGSAQPEVGAAPVSPPPQRRAGRKTTGSAGATPAGSNPGAESSRAGEPKPPASKSGDAVTKSRKTMAEGKDVLAERYVDELAGTFVLVEGGSFDMGCTSEQPDCSSDEKPVHSVTLNSYYIGQYAVTQAQWRAVMGNNPSNFSGCDQCPVEQVSWEDVQEFLQRLNARTGQHYRLPTEAEWEFAARGGNKSRRYLYAGSNNPGDVAWYEKNAGGKTHPVGQKSPNELGLYDMSGNVYEWCQDWFGDYSSSAQTNPTGPSTGSVRVRRGGSWRGAPRYCRVAFRYYDVPGYRYSNVGFRLARTP